MISQRLRGLDQDGEAIDGLIPKLQSLFSSVGINIEDQNGELRSTFDILQDLAAVWDQLSSKQKQYFGEKVAGNRQVKTLNAIMQNWDVVANTIDKANNAQGEALKGNEMYMDSIEGRMTQLQSAFQELARTTIDSDFVKGLTSAGTEVIKLVTNLGGLTPVLTSILGTVVAIRGVKIVEGLSRIKDALIASVSGANMLASSLGVVGVVLAGIGVGLAAGNGLVKLLRDMEVLPKTYADLEVASERAKQNYSEEQSKLSDLNSELSKTKEAMDALESKGSLSIIEQDEYNRLKNTNDQLERQIRLQQIKANIAEEEARNAAIDQFEGLENQRASDKLKINDRTAKAAVNLAAISLEEFNKITSQITSDLSKFQAKDESYKSAVTEAYNTIGYFKSYLTEAQLAVDSLIDNSADVNATIQSDEYKTAVAIRDYWKAAYDDKAAIITQYQSDIDEVLGPYKTIQNPQNDREKAFNQRKQEYTEIDERLLSIDDTSINEIFDYLTNKYSEATAEIKNQIQSTGDFTVDDLGKPQFEEMIQEFEKYGISAESVAQIIKDKFSLIGEEVFSSPMSIDVGETVKKLFQNTDGYTKVLTKALSEQEKAGELTASTISKLLSSDSGLPGIADCLEETANGYRLNTERVNDYINAQNADIRLNALAGIMERQIAIEDLAVKYGDLETAILSEADAQQLSNWQNEIIELQAVANEAWTAVDALDALREASKTPDEDANHSEAKSLLDKTEEKWEVGKVGSDDFKAGMDYLLGDNWLNRYDNNLEKAFKAFEEKKKKFFAEDDADSAENFMNALVDKNLATRNKKTGDIDLLTDDLGEVASALGISETAAQNLFDLLNSYSFEGKFKFGDDAITSAEKIAVAEDKLKTIKDELSQTDKDLEKAEKELEEARGTSSEAEKQKKVDDLKLHYKELEDQAKQLEATMATTNNTVEKGFEPPKTLEEALQQITDLQTAIDTLKTNGVDVPVELTGAMESLVEYISNPTNVLNVDVTGNPDDDAKKIVELKEAIDKNPSISAEVKATVTGITSQVIDNLEKFNGQVEKIGDKKGVLSKVTIRESGGKQATIALQKVEKKAEELDESDPTVSVKAELPSPDELKVIYNVEADQKSLNKSAEDIQAVADKEYTATVKTIFVDGSGEGNGVVNPNTLDQNQWKQYQQEIGDNNAIPLLLPEDPIVTPKINRTAFGQDFLDALSEAEEKSEPVNIGAEVDNNALQDSLSKTTEEPIEIPVETEQTPEEVASEFKQEWGEFWTGEKIPIDGISINQEEAEQDAEEAIKKIPEQEISAGINESQLTEQVEDAVENANSPDVVINVKQEVKGGVTKPKDVSQTVNVKGKDAGGIKAVQDVQGQAGKGATIPIDADPTEAEKKDDSLINRIKQKVIKLLGLDTNPVYRENEELEKRLAQKVQKTVEITYKETNPKPYAKGTKKAEEGLSLVDEKGAELIEHRRRGTYELGSNDGARLTHLDQGDVVHTADETKKILSRLGNVGSLIKNGLGTIKSVVGNAFASGTVREFGRVRVQPKKKREDEKKTTRTSTSSRSTPRTSTSSSSSSSSDNGEMQAWTDWVKTFFDWAEIKLKNLKDATSGFIDEAARAIGAIAKNQQLNKAMESIRKEIEANEAAYIEYYNTASRLAAGLSADIIQKIQNGDINIAEYDDLTQQKIKDYQTWYEKAMACRDAVKKLQDQEKELAKQRLQNIADYYSAEAKRYEAESGVVSSRREYEEATGQETQGSAVMKKRYRTFDLDLETGKQTITGRGTRYRFAESFGDYDEQIRQEENRLATIRTEKANLQAELDSLIASGQVTVGDSVWVEYTTQLSNLEREAYSAATGIQKLKDEAYDTGMSTIVAATEDAAYRRETTSQEVSLGNAKGSIGLKGKYAAYKSQNKDLAEENKNLEIQNELYRQRQEGLDKNSKKYRELEQKIRANEDAMRANEQAMADNKNAMNELKIENVAKGFDDLARAADKMSNSLSENMVRGIEITEQTYEDMMANAQAQIVNLTKQRKLYIKLMDNLVKKYGEEAKQSDLYKQYQSQVDSLDNSIHNLNMSILQWGDDMENLHVQKLGWELEAVKENAEELSSALSMKEARGEAVTASDYESLIENASDQKSLLQAQIDDYRRQQEGMDVNSDAYQELENKINANKKAMRSLDEATLKWEKDIQNLPIKQLGWQLDGLKAEADDLNDSLELKQAKGQVVTAGDYQALINNAYAQKRIMQEQNEYYRSMQAGMDEASDEYQELQSKIDANDKAMNRLTKSTVEWNNSIKDIRMKEISAELERLGTIANKTNKEIQIKNARGKEITGEDYDRQRLNARARIRTNNDLRNYYIGRQASTEKGSDDWQEWQQKIDALDLENQDLELEIINILKEKQNLRAKQLGWDLDTYEDIETKLNAEIDKKEYSGKELLASDYQALIDNARNQYAALEAQIREYYMQRGEMDVYSEEYQAITAKIRECENAQAGLNEATYNWRKAISQLKLDKLGWELDALNSVLDDINNKKALNDAQGMEEAVDVYKQLIDNGMARIRILEQENIELQKRQENMDKNTTAYQEIQSQIRANTNEISDIMVQQEKWNDSIVDIGIRNIQRYRDALNKSNDQLQKQKELQDAIMDLEKANSQRKVRTYVEGQGFVYQQSEDDLKKAQVNLESVVRDQLLGKLDDLIEALEEAKSNTNVYDSNGNLIGTAYNTPQLGNLAAILEKYYNNNTNATIDVDTLANALGKDILNNINTQTNNTSFNIGDIIINEANNGNDLAKAIVNQFPNALLQALYNK